MSTAHVDPFTAKHRPTSDRMPELRYDLPILQYPDRLNAAYQLVDRNVHRGNGSRRAIVAPGGIDWTYEDLLATANRIAHVLVDDCGVVPGARVLLRAPNTPILAACWLAVLKAGAVAVTTMSMYRAGELRHMIEKAQVSAALCDARLADELRSACGEREMPVLFFQTGAADGLESRMTAKPAHFETIGTAADDTAIIGFTSGTTGTPKAAMHSHRALMATCDTFGTLVLQPHRDDLFCGSPPLGFTFGLGGLLLFPLHAGAATLLLEKAGPEDLLRSINDFGVTTIFTAPIAYRTMTTLAPNYDLSSLRTCVSAGETLPKSVWEGWQAQTGRRIIDGIGSTEMLHIFIGSPSNETRPGSTGRAVPGYTAEIHDDDGAPLPVGAIGRLAVKGPTGCIYLDDERQTTYVQKGWNYPGDAYRIDEDGYLYYIARTDDMIISAGYNIAGPEVEGALLMHPMVKECAVVAKPDPQHGTHIVKAYVVLTEHVDAGPQRSAELIEHCARVIAAYKAPREIEFVSELPRTESGKVQRYKLRQRACDE